jgi:hypothetical protein
MTSVDLFRVCNTALVLSNTTLVFSDAALVLVIYSAWNDRI